MFFFMAHLSFFGFQKMLSNSEKYIAPLGCFFLRKENVELQQCRVQLAEVLSERQVLPLGLRLD